jgi:hypothetical protein
VGYGCLLTALLALPVAALAQAPPPSTDYLAPLKTKDLSYLWRTDQLVFYGTKAADGTDNAFPEPLGFIGANYHYEKLLLTTCLPAGGQCPSSAAGEPIVK